MSSEGMIAIVRAKLLLSLLAAMILIQSGPLPACLLDEAVAACFSTTRRSVMNGAAIQAPKGNDTPDEINRGWSQQESFGSDGSVLAFAHALTGAIAVSLPDFASGTGGFAIPPCHETTTSPPFDNPAYRFPLLT